MNRRAAKAKNVEAHLNLMGVLLAAYVSTREDDERSDVSKSTPMRGDVKCFEAT
jgi:hypothetical protein